MRHLAKTDRGRGARQFLAYDAGGGEIEPGPAVFQRHVEAKIAHLAQLGKDRRRQIIGVVHFRVQMMKLRHEELAGLIGQRLLFIGHEMCRKVDVVA